MTDIKAAPDLVDGLARGRILVADRGYDKKALVERIRNQGGSAHIPTQKDRKVQRSVDPALYRKRNLIERFFNKLKHFRRIFTRYDKFATNFLFAAAVASIRLWIRSYESTT